MGAIWNVLCEDFAGNLPCYKEVQLSLHSQFMLFILSEDPNIRVACLTCLGSVVSATPPLMEVWQLLQASPRHSNQRTLSQGSTLDTPSESGYQSGGLTSPGVTSPAITPGKFASMCSKATRTPTCIKPNQLDFFLVSSQQHHHVYNFSLLLRNFVFCERAVPAHI